jgi:hypothetical protein
MARAKAAGSPNWDRIQPPAGRTDRLLKRWNIIYTLKISKINPGFLNIKPKFFD